MTDAEAKDFLNSLCGRSKVIILDDEATAEYVRKRAIKKWRMTKVMDELEKNSFIKMFTEGWCSSCNFDSSKCAEQQECEAFKTVNKALNKGGDNNEETV